MLVETATKDISKVSNPKGFEDNKNIAQRGGSVAAVAKIGFYGFGRRIASMPLIRI